jgi:hypothetical protein
MIGAAAVARGPVAAALLLLLSQGSRASSPKLYNVRVSQSAVDRGRLLGPLGSPLRPTRPIVAQSSAARSRRAGKFLQANLAEERSSPCNLQGLD